MQALKAAQPRLLPAGGPRRARRAPAKRPARARRSRPRISECERVHDDWINVIVQGVLVGGLYAMFAAGLSLIFGVMRLVNIAHGDLIVLAAYLGAGDHARRSASGRSPRCCVVVPLMALIGYVLQRLPAQPHARRRPAAAAAGDVRPLGHHPERAARGCSPPTAKGCRPARSRSRRIRLLDGVMSVGVLPLLQFVARHRGDRRRCNSCSTAPRSGRAFRATADDPHGGAADGSRQPPRLRARHGAVAGGGRDRRRVARRSAPISIRRSGRRG